MSKDLFMDVRIQAEMSDDVYNQIPAHLRDSFKVKSIEADNFKDVYREDRKWKELHLTFIKALQDRQQREAEIRVELKAKAK